MLTITDTDQRVGPTAGSRFGAAAHVPIRLVMLFLNMMADTVHSVGRLVESRPKIVAGTLFGMVLFFALACALNDIIPVCHYLFRCDHRYGH